MPWVVGIDEAGYGPNLGPLVQTAVALRLPDADEGGWETLRPHVRRCGEADDGRLLIDDSKLVYAGPRGFRRLECGVAASVMVVRLSAGRLFGDVLPPESFADLQGEPWFNPAEPLPIEVDDETMAAHLARFGDAVVALGGSWAYRAVVVPPPRFNRLVAGSGSKATILSDGLVKLLGDMRAVGTAGIDYSRDPILYLCDKLGGRNPYGPLLQQAFPDGWLFTEKESAEESRYRVLDLGREVRVVFRPRADVGSVSVALASMLAKYLREVCMRQFNRFWARHVPDLRPTAGYPTDARRFYDAIRPAMDRLGIPADAVWRCR